MTTDLTTEILKQIRDGITELREDFNQRLDQTNSRLGRVEQGLNDLGEFMRRIALDQAKHECFHAHHVERLEEDVTESESARPTARKKNCRLKAVGGEPTSA